MNLPYLVEKWDNIIYLGINIIRRFKYFFNFSYKKVLKKNKTLKNKFANKRCFILLNGPSINKEDLSKLENEYVFVSNYFFKSNLMNIVKPNFYCWLDSKVFNQDDCEEIFNQIGKNKKIDFFVNIKGLKKLGNRSNFYFTNNALMPRINKVKYNMAKPFSNFGTVALYAISIAMYMGFKEIYLLGLDFEPGAFKHFQNLGIECEDPNKKSNKNDVYGNYWSYAKSHSEFYSINNTARKNKINIINLNVDSCIRAFDFAKLEDIIKSNE